MKQLIHHKYYLILLFIIGTIVYFPMFFNGFVWDDHEFLINNVQYHNFNLSIFFDNYLNTGHMYRQVLVLWYTLTYSLFGENAMYYHITQLCLHTLTALLLFFLFKYYFHKIIAYILCIFFLIHPINSETVLWISSVQTILCTLFGLIALLIAHSQKLTHNKILFLNFFLFLSLMTYELGILFFAFVFIYFYLKKSPHIKLITSLILIIILIYILLRYFGGAIKMHELTTNQEITTVAHKLFTLPSIILYYLKMVFYPKDIYIWQFWSVKQFSFIGFVVPLLILHFIMFVYLLYMQRARKRKIKGISFFSLLFFIGILPLLQIFQLDMTVADRWFYIPFIGLLGIIGIIVSTHRKSLLKYKKLIFILLILLLSTYSYRTFQRAFDWKDDITLFSHDLQYQQNHLYLNYNLAVLYDQQKNYTKAQPFMKKVKDVTTYNQYYSDKLVILGGIHSKNGNFKEAIEYYSLALENPKLRRINEDKDLYVNLTVSLLKEKRYSEIIELLPDKNIDISPLNNQLLYIRALTYYNLKNYSSARKDIERLINIPDFPEATDLHQKIILEQEKQNPL